MDSVNNAYQLGLYEKSMPNTLSWVEKLNVVKNCGFDYLEVSIDETDEKLARLIADHEDIKRAMNITGVPIRSLCLSAHRKYPLGSKAESTQHRSLEIMEGAIDFAAELGIRIIQLAGYDVYYEQSDEQTRSNFEKNLYESVKMASKKGVCLGFETMETDFMDTVSKAMHYVQLVDSAYLGLYPDIGNLKNASLLYGLDVNEDLKQGEGHLFACHLKETKLGVYREVPFGTGHTEFLRNLEVLCTLGVRMFVGEFWDTGKKAWKEDIAAAAVFLRNNLDRAFDE